MMRRVSTILSILLLAYFQINTIAQTGPAGIGNATGANGQPTNILWLRADDLGLADGAAVSAWADQSGNGNDLSSSVNDPNDPTYVLNQINSLPIVRFSSASGTGTKLIRNPFNNFASSEVTTIVIYLTNDANDGLVSYATSGDNNNFLLYNSSNLTSYIAGGNLASSYDLRSASFQIMVHKWRNSNGELHLIQNSTDVYNTTGFRTGSTITDGGSLSIGGEQDAVDGSYAASQAFDGDIAEIIMFSSYLNDAQRIIIENYLQIKYGIGISTNDHFSLGDASYINDFTGVGQEADGNHLSSLSAGFYITADNATLDDGEYLMFAHNNTTNAVSTADLPTGVQARWARDWYVEKTGNLNATLTFDLPEGIGGQYPQNISNYVLLFRNATTGNYSQVNATVNFGDADQVAFSVLDADLASGYYTLGTTDETNSPVEGAAGTTWYTLASGDWNNPDIWTLDPSGALPNNPSSTYPQNPSDKVVIKSGKNVNMNLNNVHCNELTVDGRLDLNTSTGQTFDVIKGNGRILMAADNFPSFTDMSNFNTAGQGEGTVVYYGAASYSLSNSYTFYNMEVDMDAGQTVTLLTDYTINGYLRVLGGTLQINDNTATTNLNITVQGNVTVETGASITTGSANARHQFNFYGDFTNNGTVKFTNRAAADYANEAIDGIVDANFLNTGKDQSVLCAGTTDFYRIEIDKGTDATYILDISATSTANFNLFGYAAENHPDVAQLTANNNALGLVRGTVKIGSNVNIPVLTQSGNYNISEAAKLWVAGGSTAVTGNAIVPYGELYVSAGTFDAQVTHGIALRKNGVLRVSGGTVNTNIIRTASSSAATNRGSYVQTGGTVNVINPGNATTDYYHFCLTYPEVTFYMSGGTLHVYDANGTAASEGGIFIASSSDNINVSGGTVIAEINSVTDTFKINSTAPFYNLTLRNTLNSTSDFKLANASGVGPLNIDQTPQPLVILNDLTIEQNAMLHHNSQDITIGGDLSISRDAQQEGIASEFQFEPNRGIYYENSQINTLTFNGSGNSSFYIGYNTADDNRWEFYCHNIEIAKDNVSDTITISTDIEKDLNSYRNRILHVIDTIWVRKGVINQGKQSVRLFGEVFVYNGGQMGIYEAGTTKLSAYFMLRDGDVTLNTEPGAIFGNMKLNTTGTVTLTSDVYMQRIGYHIGLMNLKTYNLKVDYLHSQATSANYNVVTEGSTTEMIYSDANASDGGISLKITGNDTYGFPLGTKTTSTRYTYAQLTVTNFVDTGYVTIRPVDGELKTTNLTGGDLLDYYWRVGYEGFTTLPTVQYEFKYDLSDDINGTDDTFYPGKVLDADPYTRSYENDLTKVDDDSEGATYTITFNDAGSGFTLEKANYTAGVANRFTGTVAQFHSNDTYTNWDAPATWLENQVPTTGSIVYIRNRNRVWGNNIPNIPAVVIFERTSTDIPTSETVPRLQFNQGGTFDIGRVQGTGMISLNTNANPTVLADWGEFANNDTAIFMYWGNTGGITLNNIPQPLPSLMLESDVFTVDQNITINADLIFNGNANATFIQNIDIKRDLVTGFWRGGTLHFPGTGSPVTITVERNVDYTQYNDQGYSRNIIVDDPGSASTLEHKLIVKGDIIHGSKSNYTLDLFNAANRPNVILELQGNGSNKYYRTSTVVPDLYRIVMNKGTSQVDTFTFEDDFVLNGATSGIGVAKALELQNGTLVLSDPDININLTTGDDNFYIPTSTALVVDSGMVNASGNSGILLDGKLFVNGGTVDMSGGDNFIQYSASGNAVLEVAAGTLKVGSQVRRGTSSTEGILTYKQSGGTVEIGTDAAGQNSRAIFEVVNAGSSFEHTGGTFTLVNDYRSNPSIASFYFNPETVNLSKGTEITFGNTNTVVSAKDFTIYAGKDLMNIRTDNSGSNSPTLTMQVVPLTLTQDMNIGTGTTVDANGLDINMYGDFNNSGIFTASQNKVYFLADTTQSINGITTFYDLYKTTGTDTLKLGTNSEITVDHYLSLESGLFYDNGNNVNVKGNLNNIITALSSGTGNGIVLNGTSQQTITGSGTYARLMMDNSSGATVPTGYNVTVTDSLILKQGIFDIGKNLLILTKDADIIESAPFSESNMISTNISFTDAGVKKYYPIITSTTTFTYPMGSAGKYTPVKFDITANGNDTASIRVKAANERHPSIIEDSETPEITDANNVLQYYWTLDANGIEGFSATATMECYGADVLVENPPYTTADYITARLLDANLGTWDKFANLDFNEATNELYFYYTGTNDQGIDGDYTAGIDDAIPDQVPSYITIADGTWSDATIWDTYPTSGGSVPAGGPRGSIVYIQHNVTTPANFVSAYITRMLATGVLNLGTTFGHRLGFVSGTGKIYLESGDLPAGVYDDFFAADSGTIEYGGSNAIDILSEITAVNNLILSGTNDRVFPNLDLVIRGNLTINGPDVKNTHNESVEVRKDVTFAAGTFDAGFDDGADVNNGMFIIGGNTTQHIYGPATFTSTNAFNHFKMNNPVGIILDQPIDIDNQLVFVSGPITTTSTNILTLHNTASDIVTGAGAGNYVDGPLKKNIINGQSFNFPTGNAGRYGNIRVFNTGTTGNEYWIAQYYNHNPGNDGYDPTVYNSPLQTVSDNEYWRVYSPVSTTAQVELRWDSQSGMPTDAANVSKTRIAEWKNTVPQWEEVDANNTVSAAGSSGTVTSTVNSNFNEWAGTGNIFTLSTTYVSQDFTWDGSTSIVWNDASNWNVNLVPTALDSVIIASGMPNDPTISINAECAGMDLQAGATLTINSGASLTLSGDLVMNGDILLKSDANGTGVLIDNGNIGGTGTATVERFLSAQKYHYISAPLSAIPHTTYYTQLPGETQVNTNYYWYDETNSNANWLYGWVAQNGTGNMTVNRGYAYYYTKDYTFVQTGGSFNTGNLSVTVSNSGNGVGSDGWNLIGNPYPSTILADEFIYNNNSVIDGTLYFWDDPGTNGSYTSSDYATWNLAGAVGTGSGTASNSITPDGYIGVGQSFFVHTDAGGTVNFSNSMRRIGNGQFFKEAAYDGVGRLKLSLSNDATRMYNELLIAFIDGASDDFDNLYDGEKLKGNPDIAFYSKLKGKDYSIQSFAPLSAYSEKVVNLGFSLNQSDNYTITVQQFENFDPAVNVYLKDNLLDSVINLRQVNAYTFNTNSGTVDNRFEVFFNYMPDNDGVVNHSPVLSDPLTDALATEDLNFEYKVATNTFKDADVQDTLSYKATLIDGLALPAWLSFNSNTLTFTGTPENKDVGILTIQLTATDLAGESTYDVFVLQVLNVNDAPEIINRIPDQSINAGEEYSYIVPQNTFIDVDKGDTIQLSAKLADGSNLPTWLNFDEQTGKLYGTAIGAGDIRISIIATDKAGASTGDEFTLSVKSVTGINSLSESKVSIYPNPTNGKFVIETNYYSDDLDIIIRDNQGRVIKQMKPQSKSTDVDISSYASGLYFIELKEKDKSVVHKINLNK